MTTEQNGVVISKLLASLRHQTGDITIECAADKEVVILTNGTERARFGGVSNLGAASFAGGIKTKQAVNNVHDTVLTEAQCVTAFGAAATLGRGFIGTIDDNDANAISYLVWCTDASFFWVIGTKAA